MRKCDIILVVLREGEVIKISKIFKKNHGKGRLRDELHELVGYLLNGALGLFFRDVFAEWSFDIDDRVRR